MRLEHRIDIAGDAGSVVGQGHSGAAHNEYVCHDASADEALTQAACGPQLEDHLHRPFHRRLCRRPGCPRPARSGVPDDTVSECESGLALLIRLVPPGTGQGPILALFSEVAERVELCLFGPGNRRETRVELTEVDGFVWHCYLPGVGPGRHYGYRVHGPYAPGRGHRCNAAKLLLDPYGKAVRGSGALARCPVLPPARRAGDDQHSQQRPFHAAQCRY
jgi:hypothetical protein